MKDNFIFLLWLLEVIDIIGVQFERGRAVKLWRANWTAYEAAEILKCGRVSR